MESSERASPTRTWQSRYAVPVTIESLSKGFVAHKFLIARHYIPQMRMFHRALYAIEFPDSPSRRVKRRLPSEIIYMITQHVKAAAIEQGFTDCERQIGGPNRSTYVELEEGLRRLERWGRSRKGLTAWPPEDTLSKFMMEQYSLSIMPGMWDAQRRGRSLTYLFLCYSPPELPHPFTIQIWNPSSYPHPALSNEMLKNVEFTPCTRIAAWCGYWERRAPIANRMSILERNFVEKRLAKDPFIGRAVRDLKLDIAFLAMY